MRDAMITYLKERNEKAIKNNNLDELATVLFYDNEGKAEFVTDYSPFINDMSESLRNALSNGQTLTHDQQIEMNIFRIDNFYKNN